MVMEADKSKLQTAAENPGEHEVIPAQTQKPETWRAKGVVLVLRPRKSPLSIRLQNWGWGWGDNVSLHN